MARNKDILYRREVSTVSVQESHRFTNPAKCNSEKRIVLEEGKFLEASSYFKDKTSMLNLTKERVISKGKLCNERNSNKGEHSCGVCGIICTGIDNLKLHIQGKKHNKKLKERKIIQQIGSTSGSIEILTTINCDACEKQFAKLDDYLLHCKGEVHQEISSLYILTKAKKLNDPYHFSEAVRRTESSPFKYCDVCKIRFKRPMDYDQHVETSEHYRKFQNQEQLPVVRDILITSEGCNKLTCQTCGKSFNGPVPYKQHLMSNTHSKKDDIANNMNMYRDLELHCKDCGKKFSGIVPFNDHLRGSSHKRQIKKNNLWKNLEEEHLGVFDYSMYTTYGEDNKSGGNVKPDCETCYSEFKKIEGVQDHHTGVKHREVTKEVHVEKLQEFAKEEESLVKEYAARLPENSWDDPLIEL